MYNMVMGTNPLAGVWVESLGLELGDFGRIRDGWLQDDGPLGLRIVIHTRCGGGNREDYEGVFEKMKGHPQYLRDYDCEYDSTYANIEFKIPEEHANGVQKLLEEAEKLGNRDVVVDNRTQTQRWEESLRDMGSPPESE